MYVTEKLDGTNSSIHIWDKSKLIFYSEKWLYGPDWGDSPSEVPVTYEDDHHVVSTASRNRWVVPGDDNYGFASWVRQNGSEIVKLGHGSHFGEWVGPSIQKNPHELSQKRFYLFNHYRWGAVYNATVEGHDTNFPKCVDVVPFIGKSNYDEEVIDAWMMELRYIGSHIGGKPEGLMVYVPEADHYQKVTFEHSEGKWKSNE